MGLITVKDIHKRRQYPNANKDQHGRLRVAAAIGAAGDYRERARALVDAGSMHSSSIRRTGTARVCCDATARSARCFPSVQLSPATSRRAKARQALVERGVDGVKVGVGPGSICTTRVVTGVGVPQLTAIIDAVERRGRRAGHRRRRDQIFGRHRQGAGRGRVECHDGLDARRNRGEPGRVAPARRTPIQDDSRHGHRRARCRTGAPTAISRTARCSAKKFVPEGIEGRVPYKGPVSDVLYQMVGGLRSGMGYVGCAKIDALRTESRFVRITPAGLRESHPHDVTITREAPNYSA